jgi:hypothetical protein
MRRLYGAALTRVEMRKAVVAAGTANIYVADAGVFAAAAERNQPVIVTDIPRFTSVSPVCVMTEVLGAFDA